MYKIMVVEDDFTIASTLKNTLEKWGYEASIVTDFDNVLEHFITYAPHLILMDITLPKFDGYYFCQKIREHATLPILFMSSRDGNMDIIMAINLGADDYITKPFDLNLLLAKITALLRRSYAYQENTLALLEYEHLILNLDQMTATYFDATISLTKNELRILKRLIEKAPQVVSREDIIRTLWDHESFVDDNTLTVNINRLRKKLESLSLTDWLQTKKGQGYAINAQKLL